jgi:hypothetical protein
MLKHEQIEKSVGLLIVLTLLVVSVGGLLEIVPLFFQKSTTTPVEGVKPYSAVQVAGRDVYVREGCYLCHSQMIRPSAVRPSVTVTTPWPVSTSMTIRSSGVPSVPVPICIVLAAAIPMNGSVPT